MLLILNSVCSPFRNIRIKATSRIILIKVKSIENITILCALGIKVIINRIGNIALYLEVNSRYTRQSINAASPIGWTVVVLAKDRESPAIIVIRGQSRKFLNMVSNHIDCQKTNIKIKLKQASVLCPTLL